MMFLNCTDHTSTDQFVSLSSFYLEDVGIPVVGGFGILGNILSVMVLRWIPLLKMQKRFIIFLRRPQMRSSFNSLLLKLVVLDTLFLVTCIWDHSCMKVWGLHLTAYVYIFPTIWYPGKNILLSWTTFLIMGLATERFLAVCRFVKDS